MTTRQLVGQLKNQGYEVTYRIRSDGGVLITSINGQRFKGATGNKFARSLLGVELSQRRSQQLNKITRARRHYRLFGKVETPYDLEKFRKSVMRRWKKAGLTGSISKYNLQRIIEERGFEGAEVYLREMERHTQGLAYYGQIEALLSRIDEDKKFVMDDQVELDYLNKTYNLIKDNKDLLTPEMVFNIFNVIYDWEYGRIQSTSAIYSKTLELLS